MDAIAAAIFSLCVVCAALFQLALACGAPLGHLAMGGRYPGRFPPPLRVAALVQALVLSGFALIALTKAKLVFPQYYELAENAMWLVAGISALSLAMNLMTPSKAERQLWAPVAAAMLASSSWLALA